MDPVTLDLSMNIEDVFGYINQLFAAVWPLLAVGLGVLFAPKIVNMVKSVAGGRR